MSENFSPDITKAPANSKMHLCSGCAAGVGAVCTVCSGCVDLCNKISYYAAVSAVLRAAAGRPLKLRIHPSSVLFRTQPQLVVFLSCQQNDEGWYEMQGVTAIQPDWLTELAPGVFQRH